jgi:hypothetical protein
MSALAQLVCSPRFAEREDVLNDGFDYARIDQFGDLL